VGEVNQDHVNAIALTGGDWPAIVVRRSDYAVVDGWHRTLAARQLGHSYIQCVFFDGRDEDTYLEALR
jgi:hypothetical protein